MEQERREKRLERERYADFKPRAWTQEEVRQATVRRCARCGAELEDGAKFCEECGMPVTDASLRCSFCGAEMEEDEKFCSECGASSEGIPCSNCGALSRRNFCSKCNTPLTAGAFRQLERARNNPKVIRVAEIVRDLDALEEEIEILEKEVDAVISIQTEDFLNDTVPLDEDTCNLLDEYRNLFDGNINSVEDNRPKPEEKPSKPEDAENIRRKREQLRELKAKKRAKKQEIQQALADLIPDPLDPPEVQRDFICATKVVAYEHINSTERVKIGWKCDYCGLMLSTPSACGENEFGGHWVYEDKEVITLKAKTGTAYI
jgi:putative virion core protein (lumpy skin disease virus)